MRLLTSDAQAISNGLHAFFQLWNAEHRNALRARFDDELASG